MSLLILSSSIVLVIYLSKKIAAFSFFGGVRWPLAASLVQSVWYWGMIGHAPYNIPRLIIVGIVGVILYGGIVWFIEKQRILNVIKMVRHEF